MKVTRDLASDGKNGQLPMDKIAVGARAFNSNLTLRMRAVFGLVAVDLLAILLGFGLVAALRQPLASDLRWLLFVALVTPSHFFNGVNIGAYNSAVFKHPLFAIKRGCQAEITAVLILIVLFFFLKVGEAMPRLTIAGGTLLSLTFVGVGRYFFVRHLNNIIGGDPFKAVLIRDDVTAIPPGDFSIIIEAQEFFEPDSHDPLMYDRLASSLSFADRVVVACPPERRFTWAEALRGANIQSEIAVPELDAITPIGVGTDRRGTTLIVAIGPLTLFQRAVKRLFDLGFALAAGILLLPLMLAVALIIKLETPGPALFRQVRIGRGNQLFNLYKFRSMRSEQVDHSADRLVQRDDDRVTRVGRFIRKTSIDELPQLLCVIRGEMSVVGPRPHALGARAATKLYWEVDTRYWHRHAIKPGLTGLAQVRGHRGNTEYEDDLRNRLEADLEYLERWSIFKDIKIIVLTIRVVLHENAF